MNNYRKEGAKCYPPACAAGTTEINEKCYKNCPTGYNEGPS
jgi:hypothetical protein